MTEVKTAQLSVQRLKLSEVSHHPDNPRYHSRQQIEQIAASIEAHGYAKGSMVVQASSMSLVAGNGVYNALTLLEYTEADFIVMDMDDNEAMQFLIRDNRLGELSRWDMPVLDANLATLKDAGLELEDMAFTMEAMEELDAAELKRQADNRVVKQDDPPAVSEEEPITQMGDLWLMGGHRVLCGDSTKAEDVERVMCGEKADMVFTDPPYGMNLDTDWSDCIGSIGSIGRRNSTKGNKYDPVIGDDRPFDPSHLFLIDCREMFLFGADYYAEFIPHRQEGSWLVWDKRKESQADAIGCEFELIWSKQKHKRRMLRHDWFGFLSSDNQKDARNRIHPTQKPVTLVADILRQWGETGDIVCDPYLRSGTTLIAADQLDRKCYGIEIAPRYVDVVVKRYINHAGSSDDVFVERDGKRMTWDEAQHLVIAGQKVHVC